MTRSVTAVLFAALVSACGSKPAAPTTPPSPPEPNAGAATEEPPPAGSDAARPAAPEPERPAEPPKPVEAAKPDPAAGKADLLAAETGAWDTAKPVLQKYCATCHTREGKKAAKKKLDHFDLGSYPPGGHHTATIGFTIRDVLGITGKKPTMPYGKPGSVTGDELAAIKAWTDAWDAAEHGGAHPAAADHHH
jgi:hypothetical protein